MVEKLPAIADKDIGFILKNTGMTLLSSVGGASGPLFGTFFIRAAQATQARQSLTLEELERNLIGAYCTSLDMTGFSITLLKVDDETLALWDAPVHTPALNWGK